MIDERGRPFALTSAAAQTQAYRVEGQGSDKLSMVRTPEADGTLGGYC